jgi:Type II CAAX prenyl endopeptidase Rce1-like
LTTARPIGWIIGAAAIPVWTLALLNGYYLGALLRWNIAAFWIEDFIHWVIVPALTVVLLKRRCDISSRDYGLPWPPSLAADLVGISIFVGITLFGAWFIPQRIAWAVLGHPQPYFLLGDAMPANGLKFLLVLYLALTAGLVESIFFIGLPWLALKRIALAPSKVTFTILSSQIFALTHWEQGAHSVVGAFFFGVISCVWYFKLRDLWPVVLAHTAIDLLEFW